MWPPCLICILASVPLYMVYIGLCAAVYGLGTDFSISRCVQDFIYVWPLCSIFISASSFLSLVDLTIFYLIWPLCRSI